MRRMAKTAVLFVAALVYAPLIIDWCMPGNGLHQATVALGGFGPDAFCPFSDFFLWDLLVRRIGWDLHGLGILSMVGALVTLGLIAYIANRVTDGCAVLSTGLVCAAFIATPGLLRAATRPDPLLVILIAPLAGSALFIWLLTAHFPIEMTATERIRRFPWVLVVSSLLMAYGIFESSCLGFTAAIEDAVHLLWFFVLGFLPHLYLDWRMRWRISSLRFLICYFGIWSAAIVCSAIVAVNSFGIGRASGHLAKELIANAGSDRAIMADPALADIYLWTLSPERRQEALSWWRAEDVRRRPPVERYFPTVDLWRENWVHFTAMSRFEPNWEGYRRLFRTGGNRLGGGLLEADDLKGAWTIFWEVMNRVDKEDGVAILNLCGLIERGYEADPADREKLSRRLLWLFRGLKMSERLTDENRETAKKVQRTIQASIANKLIRPDQIGRKLLDLDLLLGDWESAERDAQGILLLDRQQVQALTVMGDVCGRHGDYPESERYLRRALETGKAGASVTNSLAFTMVCMGHAREAVPLARSLVRTDLDNWNFRETLALALIRSGELEEGERELKAAANLARQANIPSRAQIRLAVDRAWLFKAQKDSENLKKTLRVLENLKGLERGLRMEIEEIAVGKGKRVP